MLSPELTKNRAGGDAFALSPEGALVQYAVTGIIGNVGSARPSTKIDQLVQLATPCSSEYIAKVAVYARQCGFIKDAPAVLVAYLSTRDDKQWFHRAFDHTIDNVGMVRKFVSIVRAGHVGRRSLGSAGKKAVARFFDGKSADRLFWQATGTQPTIGDVIHLAHPRPNTPEKDALFAYFIGKDYDVDALPKKVRAFEAFKSGDVTEVPDVPFGRLTSLGLSTDQWEEVFRKMTWNQLRKNLVVAQRHGLFERPRFTRWAAAKLRDTEHVKRQKVLPFSLLPTIAMAANSQNIPAEVAQAVRDALDITLESAPHLEGQIEILIDTSGSMRTAVNTADRGGRGTRIPVRYVDVAAIFTSAMLAANPANCTVTPFDTRVHPATNIHAGNSLTENTNRLAKYGGGGTNIASGLLSIVKRAQETGEAPDLVMIISDNESWLNSSNWGWNRYGTETMAAWAEIKKLNPGAKLVCWNIADGMTSQAPDSSDTLNIGGYTDVVFDLVKVFYEVSTPEQWSEMINRLDI